MPYIPLVAGTVIPIEVLQTMPCRDEQIQKDLNTKGVLNCTFEFLQDDLPGDLKGDLVTFPLLWKKQ